MTSRAVTPWYRRVVFALTRTRAVRAVVGPKLFAPADKWVRARSGGRHGLTPGSGVSGLLLTTTGRRTGLRRSVALVAAASGDDFVVVASNWGRPRHPAWSENLLDEPRAHVDCAAGSFDVLARLCGPAEKASRWPDLVRAMPLWDQYQRTVDRELRVFVLERC